MDFLYADHNDAANAEARRLSNAVFAALDAVEASLANGGHVAACAALTAAADAYGSRSIIEAVAAPGACVRSVRNVVEKATGRCGVAA